MNALFTDAWSPYILAPGLAWLLSQLCKYSLRVLRNRSLKNYSLFYQSGGMPSAHSAVVVSLLTMVALKDGIGSSVFSVALVLAAVVVYDAMNVRRAVGEQGRALQLIQKKLAIKTSFFRSDGHTLPQVIAGAILGAVLSVIMYQFFN